MIARAAGWVRTIVAAIGVTERYINRIISGAFLSLEIVTAIVQGRGTSEFTLGEMLENVPPGWAEQKNRLTCGRS